MNNKGFTMVELLSVMVILAIIMIIAIPTYSKVAANIKQSNYDNKTNVISKAMLRYANKYLLDDIKPDGNNCNISSSCCKRYELYSYIVTNSIYDAEENGEIINPLNNGKLKGYVEVTYNKESYDLTASFKESDTTNFVNGVGSCT